MCSQEPDYELMTYESLSGMLNETEKARERVSRKDGFVKAMRRRMRCLMHEFVTGPPGWKAERWVRSVCDAACTCVYAIVSSDRRKLLEVISTRCAFVQITQAATRRDNGVDEEDEAIGTASRTAVAFDHGTNPATLCLLMTA